MPLSEVKVNQLEPVSYHGTVSVVWLLLFIHISSNIYCAQILGVQHISYINPKSFDLRSQSVELGKNPFL